MSKQSPSSSERRSFFTSLNAGFVSLAALAAGKVAFAQEVKEAVKEAKPAARFEPARHDKDDWFDIPAKHRLVFDTTNATALGDAIFFANNFIRVNRVDYGLQNSDLAVVIIVRHQSTGFGYSDAMWARYGAAISARSFIEDPKSRQAPKVNMFNSGDYADLLNNHGVTLDAVSKLGVRLAVCASATRANAGAIARATGGDVEAINSELIANLVGPNARMVPAGIVALGRAQERGYSVVKA